MSSLSLIPEEKIRFKSRGNNVGNHDLPKISCTMYKKKILHPLLSTTAMTINSNHVNKSSNGDKNITKRLLSAKEHRLKQIQNQLADAHYRLNELSNENRLLRSLQKRMDSALQRYENSNADIPNLLNRHNEEIRSWQVRYKKLRAQLKDNNEKLKEKNSELQHLNDDHKHLLTLSKDTSLIEREKLTKQVIELTEKINKQNETISTLQRKIILENKSHKHQLNSEITKHKETQSQLNIALGNCERLTQLLELQKKEQATTTSNILKRNSKTSSKILENKYSRHYDIESNKNVLNLNFKLNGNLLQENETSNESSSKLENGTDDTFNFIDKKTIGYSSSDGNSISKNSSDGSNEFILPENSNTGIEPTEDISKIKNKNAIKNRVDAMKTQIRNQSKSNDYVFDNFEGTIVEKDITDIASYLKNEDVNNTMLNLNKKSSSEEDISEKIFNSVIDNTDVENRAFMMQFDMNRVDKTCAELEKKSVIEKKKIDDLIENLCNDAMQNFGTSKNIPEKYKSNENINDGILTPYKKVDETDFLEVNNNSKTISKKKKATLDEEKKKKLLATLKAIDCGEEDGLTINSIKKERLPEK